MSTDLVLQERHDVPLLFGSDDPAEILDRVGQIAAQLADVIRKQHLSVGIKGRDYVLVEGWTTLGALTGVFPVTVWTRKLPDGDGWEARVEARTLDGRVVGAAEGMCSRDEQTWRNREEYALRSMAATRATAKALRGPLGFVVSLAGFAATPAEEMPDREERIEPTARRSSATRTQLGRLSELVKELGELDPTTDWGEVCKRAANVGSATELTGTAAVGLIRQLEDAKAQLFEESSPGDGSLPAVDDEPSPAPAAVMGDTAGQAEESREGAAP